MPATQHQAASECQNAAGTLQAPSQLPVVLHLSQWHQATAQVGQVPIHTNGGIHMPGGHSGGIWEASNPLWEEEGERKTKGDTCPSGGCIGMERGSQNKKNHAPQEAFIIQL